MDSRTRLLSPDAGSVAHVLCGLGKALDLPVPPSLLCGQDGRSAWPRVWGAQAVNYVNGLDSAHTSWRPSGASTQGLVPGRVNWLQWPGTFSSLRKACRLQVSESDCQGNNLEPGPTFPRTQASGKL